MGISIRNILGTLGLVATMSFGCGSDDLNNNDKKQSYHSPPLATISVKDGEVCTWVSDSNGDVDRYVVLLDGKQIRRMPILMDYRFKSSGDCSSHFYDKLPKGRHTLTIVATDDIGYSGVGVTTYKKND